MIGPKAFEAMIFYIAAPLNKKPITVAEFVLLSNRSATHLSVAYPWTFVA